MYSIMRNLSETLLKFNAGCHRNNIRHKYLSNDLVSSCTLQLDDTQNSHGKVFKSVEDVVSDVRDGSRLMIGGFGTCGTPDNLVHAIYKNGAKNLTIIANSVINYHLDALFREQRATRLIASYIGQSANIQKLYLSGQLELELSPQGTLAERIRAAGAGIPAFYTPTGYGTVVQEGQLVIKYDDAGNPEIFNEARTVRKFDEKNFIMETALAGDFAFVKAWKADKAGNLVFRKSARNFNPIMCTACTVTIVEAEEIVEVGQLDPNEIHLPGIYVDRIVHVPVYGKHDKSEVFRMPQGISSNEARNRIIRRAVLEIQNGMYVNLGIGMPMMAGNMIPKTISAIMQSENGILGVGRHATEDQIDVDLINSGNEAVTVAKGAAFFDSAQSFGMIRGGHIDLTMLGAMQVSERGDLANWLIPKTMVKGMGGAMDLVSSTETKVVVTMEHKARDGSPKILVDCSLPLTGKECVDLIITDLAVFQVNKGKGLKLIEIAPDSDILEIRRSTACDFEVSNDLSIMGQAEIEKETNSRVV